MATYDPGWLESQLSPMARLVLIAIGSGMRLRVPFDCSESSLVESHPTVEPHLNCTPIPIPGDTVRELLEASKHHQCPLVSMEPDTVRDSRGRTVLEGWRELGLDGDKADFYRLVR